MIAIATKERMRSPRGLYSVIKDSKTKHESDVGFELYKNQQSNAWQKSAVAFNKEMKR